MGKPLRFRDMITSKPTDGEDDTTNEALNMSQRLARKRLMRKLAPKIKIGRERAKRRMPDMARFKRRSQKAARNFFLKKLSKGVSKGELPMQKRMELEKRLEKPAMKKRIEMLSKRLLKDVRKKEMDRRKQK
jgi:hypothetical protein